jgi:hypothetical protein
LHFELCILFGYPLCILKMDALTIIAVRDIILWTQYFWNHLFFLVFDEICDYKRYYVLDTKGFQHLLRVNVCDEVHDYSGCYIVDTTCFKLRPLLMFVIFGSWHKWRHSVPPLRSRLDCGNGMDYTYVVSTTEYYLLNSLINLNLFYILILCLFRRVIAIS